MAKREKCHKIGQLLLDVTMQTWPAVAGNTFAVAAYFSWNAIAPQALRVDPYPYPFLCTMLTAASYLQGLVILAIAKKTTESQKRAEDAQRMQLDMMAKHARYTLTQTEALHALLQGQTLPARSETHSFAGSGIPGDHDETGED